MWLDLGRPTKEVYFDVVGEQGGAPGGNVRIDYGDKDKH